MGLVEKGDLVRSTVPNMFVSERQSSFQAQTPVDIDNNILLGSPHEQ